MRILLLNQTFHPDRVATAQYLTDVAEALVAAGHGVTVLTSARAYDDPSRVFPARESWRGVDIIRVRPFAFGKTARWRRAADFGSYVARCLARLATLARHDVVVALTSPPLISVLGATYAKLHNARFVFWVMDLNPDEAIAAGWLKERSFAARALSSLLCFSLRKSDAVIALDRFMRDIITSKGAPADAIHVLPPWGHACVAFDAAGREAFRRTRGWNDRFVVMYAGNHSPCNPLDTLIAAADELRGEREIVFCFLGGGSVFRELQRKPLPNVVCEPYVPREQLSAALSAADLHVVTLGDAFRGLIHPSKIYNVVQVGAPVLYIGPEPSHVTELLSASGHRGWYVRHGASDAAVEAIRDARLNPCARRSAAGRFAADRLLPAFIDLVTGDPVADAPVFEQV